MDRYALDKSLIEAILKYSAFVCLQLTIGWMNRCLGGKRVDQGNAEEISHDACAGNLFRNDALIYALILLHMRPILLLNKRTNRCLMGSQLKNGKTVFISLRSDRATFVGCRYILPFQFHVV